MTVQELKNELDKFNPNLQVYVNDNIEAGIRIEQKKYIYFPFTDNNELMYINLKSNN